MARQSQRISQTAIVFIVAAVTAITAARDSLAGQGEKSSGPSPVINITPVPLAGLGGDVADTDIAGRVEGISPSDVGKYVVVLYSYSEGGPEGPWSIQPFVGQSDTPLGGDCSWNNRIHSGTKYAALLVRIDQGRYNPPPHLSTLPPISGRIVARALVTGTPSGDAKQHRKRLRKSQVIREKGRMSRCPQRCHTTRHTRHVDSDIGGHHRGCRRDYRCPSLQASLPRSHPAKKKTTDSGPQMISNATSAFRLVMA